MKSHTLNELAIASRRAGLNAFSEAADDRPKTEVFWRQPIAVERMRLQRLRNADLLASIDAKFSNGDMQRLAKGQPQAVESINQDVGRNGVVFLDSHGSTFQKTESVATYTQVVVLDEKVATQRKVLEQALTTINANHHWHTEYDDFDGYGTKSQLHTQNIAAIAAIQGVLK